MFAAVYSIIKRNTAIIKLWAAISLLLLQSCCSPYAQSVYKPAIGKNGKPYTATGLAQELREKSKGKNPIFNLPTDNDEDYKNPANNTGEYFNQPLPGNAAQDNDADSTPLPPSKPSTPGKMPKMPIPQDMDEDSGSGYPIYDPEEDNSGYYYQPHAKPLPKPKKDETGKPTYPIYFDN
jgi:hypothetical protein